MDPLSEMLSDTQQLLRREWAHKVDVELEDVSGGLAAQQSGEELRGEAVSGGQWSGSVRASVRECKREREERTPYFRERQGVGREARGSFLPSARSTCISSTCF